MFRNMIFYGEFLRQVAADVQQLEQLEQLNRKAKVRGHYVDILPYCPACQRRKPPIITCMRNAIEEGNIIDCGQMQ